MTVVVVGAGGDADGGDVGGWGERIGGLLVLEKLDDPLSMYWLWSC